MPVAGSENPYQILSMQQINNSGDMIAVSGVQDKFFGIIRTAVFVNPDILHFDWIESFYFRRWSWLTYLSIPSFFLQLFITKYICKIKIAFTLHNIYPHDTKHKNLHHRVHQKCMKYADVIRVFYTSSVQKVSETFQLPAEKIKVAAHPDYVGYYPNTISKTQARKILNLPAEKKVFLFFGTIRKYKGLDTLIDIFRNRDYAQDCILLIAGRIHDSEYTKTFSVQTSENIIIHSHFIQDAEVQNYFNACEAVILPFSNVESSGTVILAMGFAKPVITSATFSVAEILQQQKQFLYKEDVQEVLDTVLNMHAEELEEIGRKNLKTVKLNNTTALHDILLGVKSK